jgi:hypothetical protein
MYRPRTKTLRALLVTAALALCALTMLGANPSATNQANVSTAPTLQQLFPKSGLLGAPATQVTFSHDGKYGAYVHNRDLFILDTTSNTPFRAISPTTLAKFRDADTDTPKEYHGVFAYTWSPAANELLLLCEGHLYRYQVASQEITRLTEQRMSAWEQPWSERLYYLPDGSGYLFARGYHQSLLTVWQGNFATREFKSWTPRLPPGEQLLSLELSPDGRQLVLTTRRGLHPMVSSGSAKISSYRDRFMQVQTVPLGVARRTPAGLPAERVRRPARQRDGRCQPGPRLVLYLHVACRCRVAAELVARQPQADLRPLLADQARL